MRDGCAVDIDGRWDNNPYASGVKLGVMVYEDTALLKEVIAITFHKSFKGLLVLRVARNLRVRHPLLKMYRTPCEIATAGDVNRDVWGGGWVDPGERRYTSSTRLGQWATEDAHEICAHCCS